MAIKVAFSDDPAQVLTEAGKFLTSEPVLHNVILTLLHEPPRQRHGLLHTG